MNVVKIKKFCKEHKKEILLGSLGIGVGIVLGGKIHKPVNKSNYKTMSPDDPDQIVKYIDLLQYSIKHSADGVYRGYMADANYTISDLGAIGKDLCSNRPEVSINDKVIGVSLITKK